MTFLKLYERYQTAESITYLLFHDKSPYHIEASQIENWFIYDRDLHHEKINQFQRNVLSYFYASRYTAITIAKNWIELSHD